MKSKPSKTPSRPAGSVSRTPSAPLASKSTVGQKPESSVRNDQPYSPEPNAVRNRILIALALFAGFLWSYWPALLNLITQWDRIPDYSHGYLVVPVAIIFAWLRWESRPNVGRVGWFFGIALITIAAAMRIVAALYYLEPLDGWSIPFWIAGAIALVFGNAMLVWLLPSVLFLFFMVPLPYSLERMMAQPLQSISTKMSTFALQSLQQPAIAEGYTIVLGQETLEVARACSGLRIFMGIAAMAYAVVVLFPRPLGNTVLIALAILPIALIANATRIVATGLLYQWGYSETARQMSHDVAGWVMIPLAAGLFLGLLWYLDRLFYRVEHVDSAVLIQSQVAKS